MLPWDVARFRAEKNKHMQTQVLKDELQPTLSEAIRYAPTNRSAGYPQA